jgi:hypothetical protein
VVRYYANFYSSERLRHEYIEQLISDIASYYGYNEFLAEKLFQLFPVAEVYFFRSVFVKSNTKSRPSNFLKLTKFLDPSRSEQIHFVLGGGTLRSL